MLKDLFLSCLNADYREVDHGGSWAYRREANALSLYFQHSRGLTDWRNNLDFAAVPYRDVSPVWHCHAGFLRVWKSLRPHLGQ